MILLRRPVAIFVVALLALIAWTDAHAQEGRGKGGTVDPSSIPSPPPGEAFDVPCPYCGKKYEVRDTQSTATCPHCKKNSTVQKSGDELALKGSDESENKWKKPLLIGGGVLLVLGVIGSIVRRTMLAPPPKKKKKRPTDDDDDDRPRKKKRPAVIEDDDDNRPKPKKKPRVVDD
jgi:predicted  nucleic acid-binding Zn-ribbon protein